MHKKLEADLTSLAHSILQMKNKEDVFVLQKKAHEVYEKLSVLAYVEEYINNTPNPEHTKEELLEKIESINIEEVKEESEVVDEVIDQKIDEVKVKSDEAHDVVKHDLEEEESVVEDKVDEVEGVIEESKEEEPSEEPEIILEVVEEEVQKVKADEAQEEELFTSEPEKEEKEMPTLEEELQDTIAVDVVADLFENAPKKSLNDKLQGDIQIGLNDRIAFVKNLFDGSQEDFNRVVSQLNTLKTEKEAKKFINKMVKPDYDWAEKEELEERFMSIVERKFA
tara:strand:- start:39966 stop:40808 length:843 start_codon:yes stop_codon:yes gene_type:complete